MIKKQTKKYEKHTIDDWCPIARQCLSQKIKCPEMLQGMCERWDKKDYTACGGSKEFGGNK